METKAINAKLRVLLSTGRFFGAIHNLPIFYANFLNVRFLAQRCSPYRLLRRRRLPSVALATSEVC